MKLEKFLESARTAGHTLLRIVTPRGQEIYRGDLNVSAEDLEARCCSDAATLSAEKRHEYTVHVETEDGRKAERHTVRVLGGDRPETGHVVDPLSSTTNGAVIGHLTRALVDLCKQNTALCLQNSKNDSEERREELRELSKLRRAAMRHGDLEALRLIIEQKSAEEQRNGSIMAELGKEAVGFVKQIAGRVSPDAAAAALTQFRSSITPQQHETAAQAFGAVTWARILAAPNAEGVVELLASLPQEAFGALMGALTPEQQQLGQAALASAFQKYSAAREAQEARPS